VPVTYESVQHDGIFEKVGHNTVMAAYYNLESDVLCSEDISN
jgi:hypothetical protein